MCDVPSVVVIYIINIPVMWLIIMLIKKCNKQHLLLAIINNNIIINVLKNVKWKNKIYT